MKYELEPFHRDTPEADLLADLRRVAEELGKNRVTYRDYNERGRFTSSTLAKRFGSWFAAIDKANLRRTINRNVSDDDLFANLVEVWTNLGRQPRYRDLRPGPSRFSSNTYAHRFRTWRRALAAFVQWANHGDISPRSEEGTKRSGKQGTRNINWRLRALVLMRDGAKCRLCGAVPSDGIRLHVDHVKPWSKGGMTVIENLQILCNVCNLGKGDAELDD
jgi:5-methylcytosine-specific restriction endonuclease McrA